MRETYGAQQGDAWLRARVGRITGSKIADVCARLTRKSVNKKAGDYAAARDNYMLQLIAERLTGRAADHYNSPAMQRGSELEDDARRCYAALSDDEVTPVGFVLHPLYDFTGASADALVGDDGVLEIKCLLPWNHLSYVLKGTIPEDYMPQIAWEIACAGRKWCDLVLYCPDIVALNADRLRFFYRRIEISDLKGETVDSEGKTIALEGQAVLDYITSEVLAMERDIQDFMKREGCTPIAPFDPLIKDSKEPAPIDPEMNITDEDWDNVFNQNQQGEPER